MAKLRRTVTSAKPFIAAIPGSIARGGAKYLQQVAYLITETVRDIILNQFGEWPPLNPEYLARKKKLGYDERILIATGQYVKALTVIKVMEEPKEGTKGSKGIYRVGVGVRENATRRARVAMGQLMKWLEYGTTRMPPRAHWRPVWEQFRVEMPRHAERIRLEILRDLFARKYGVVRKTRMA